MGAVYSLVYLSQGSYEFLIKDLNRLKERLGDIPAAPSDEMLSCVRCSRFWKGDVRPGTSMP